MGVPNAPRRAGGKGSAMAGVICIRTSMLRLARSVTCGTLMHELEPVNVNETIGATASSVFRYSSSAPTRDCRRRSAIVFRSLTGSRPLVSGHRSPPNACPVLAFPGTEVSYSLIRSCRLARIACRPVRPFEPHERFVVVQVSSEESWRTRRRAHQLTERGNRSVVQIRRLRPDAVQHVGLVAVRAFGHPSRRVAEVLVEPRLPVALRHAPIGAGWPWLFRP